MRRRGGTGSPEGVPALPEVPERVEPQPGELGCAVYDANALFAKHGRYLLLSVAVGGLVQAKWSADVLHETAGNLARRSHWDSLEDFARWMRVVRDSDVTGYHKWIERVDLPDEGDRHVVACAIECGATTVVTANLADFPAEALDPFGVRAVSPDAFAAACLEANPALVVRVCEEHPTLASRDYLDRLARTMPVTAAAVRDLL